MTREWPLMIAILAGTAGAARAEVVRLTDGRSLEGRITEYADSVRIETETATHFVPRRDILAIDRSEVTRSDLLGRLATLDPTDAEALYQTARWAETNGFAREARELYAESLILRPGDARIRRHLGHVQIDGQWYPAEEALAIARGWWAANLAERASSLLRMLLENRNDSRLRRDALELLARIGVYNESWVEVRTLWESLRGLARSAEETVQLDARLTILDENPDGMLLVLGSDMPIHLREDESKPSGFYALSDESTLRMALARQARQYVAIGEQAIARAADLENRVAVLDDTNRTAVDAALRDAASALDRADALENGMAMSHRLELARRRIGVERRVAETHAAQFDAEMADYQAAMSATRSTKRVALQRMLGRLNRVVTGLEAVQTIADAFPDELELEIQWTRLDLERVRGHRRAVRAALDATR